MNKTDAAGLVAVAPHRLSSIGQCAVVETKGGPIGRHDLRSAGMQKEVCDVREGEVLVVEEPLDNRCDPGCHEGRNLPVTEPGACRPPVKFHPIKSGSS